MHAKVIKKRHAREIVLGRGGGLFTPCLCFDLLVGQKLISFYFELKL